MQANLAFWDKSHVLVYNPFYMLLGSVSYCFVEYFCVYIHTGYWSVPILFYFLVMSLHVMTQ